jgi:tRNA threonylcarbamoyl adenosine modification protein YeaZ
VRTLVIDTATKACSVALLDGEDVIASAHEVIGRGHAERLLPLIAALPERGKADRIVVDVGPGSFTGIRVGVAAAKALGMAWRVPVHGYGCLTLVAAMAREQIGGAAPVDVVMTGGHGEYFFEAFDLDGASISPVVSIQPDKIGTLSRASTVAGDIAPANDGRQYLDILPDASKWPFISSLPTLAPSPVYGRAPDAKPPKAVVG